jgi:hypothetical protein
MANARDVRDALEEKNKNPLPDSKRGKKSGLVVVWREGMMSSLPSKQQLVRSSYRRTCGSRGRLASLITSPFRAVDAEMAALAHHVLRSENTSGAELIRSYDVMPSLLSNANSQR